MAGRRQAIIWTNAGILLIGPLGTNFNEIVIKIYTFLFKKMHLKIQSGKWQPFCLGLNTEVWCSICQWRGSSLDQVMAYHLFPTKLLLEQIDGLAQERCNSSVLAMELRFSCTNPQKCRFIFNYTPHIWTEFYTKFTHFHSRKMLLKSPYAKCCHLFDIKANTWTNDDQDISCCIASTGLNVTKLPYEV